MAVTSIWRVHGWLGKVVIYVENPEKTTNPAFYEKQEMTDRQMQGLSDVIEYAMNSEKTTQAASEATSVMQSFVSGIVDEVLLKTIDAPVKKVRSRDEAR